MRPISTKELNYVRDHLSWELLSAKACRDAANATPEEKFKRLFDETGSVHQRNYESLMSFIKSVQAGQGGGRM